MSGRPPRPHPPRVRPPRPPPPAVVLQRRDLRFTPPPWELAWATSLTALGLADLLPEGDAGGPEEGPRGADKGAGAPEAAGARDLAREPGAVGPAASGAVPSPPGATGPGAGSRAAPGARAGRPPKPPDAPVLVSARAMPMGASGYLLDVTIEADIGRTCDVCNGRFIERLVAPLRLWLSGDDTISGAPKGRMGSAGGAGGAGISSYETEEWEVPFPASKSAVDLSAAVRDGLRYGVPTRARCSEACAAAGHVFSSSPPSPAPPAAPAARGGSGVGMPLAAATGAVDPRWAALAALAGSPPAGQASQRPEKREA